MSGLEKTRKRLRRHLSRALIEHGMLATGDRVLVGLSGGKDSWALLDLLADLRARAPFSFSLRAVTIDGGFAGLDPSLLAEGCAERNVPFDLVRQRIFETVTEKKDPGSAFCSLCAKLRRGALYSHARRVGATKIALGHHLDDALETLFLNLFFGGRAAALAPVLASDRGNATIVRPLIYCDEASLAAFADRRGFPLAACACPVCPSHPDHEHGKLRRRRIKEWISALALETPGLHAAARRALCKLEPERFLDPRYAASVDRLRAISS